MENLFIKTDNSIAKIISGRYEYMGAHFYIMIIPEKMSLITRYRLKKQLRKFRGAYVYTTGCDVSGYGLYETDGSLCIIEHIEDLCRRLCKNKGIPIPPTIGISDRIFCENTVDILHSLGRFCSEIYIFTDNAAAHSYADYMLAEYGCMVYVKKEITSTDILITADPVDASDAVVIDLYGMNMYISQRVADVSVDYDYGADEHIAPSGIISGRLYDFLRLSGMKKMKKINIVKM